MKSKDCVLHHVLMIMDHGHYKLETDSHQLIFRMNVVAWRTKIDFRDDGCCDRR